MTTTKLPTTIQRAVNEACAQTGLLYMSLGDIAQVFEDDEKDHAEIAFIQSHPESLIVFPE